MKKIIAPCLLLLAYQIFFTTACKKNTSTGTAGKETVLSKIFIDGSPSDQFIYNSNKQLQKHIISSPVVNSEEFEYDNDGNLVVVNFFNAAGEIQKSNQYTNDVNGRPVMMEIVVSAEFPVPTITDRIQYSYDPDGRIIRESWLDPDTGEEIKYSTITWFENGILKKYERFNSGGPIPVLINSIEFTQDTGIPLAISKIKSSPVSLDLAIYYAKKYRTTKYNAGEISSDYEDKLSKRVYDDNGYLLGQKRTTTFFKPVKPDDIRDITYEYTEL